jgi:hypothetical protein
MDLGASTANISTATAAFNDDDSNLDMFGDDDNDDVKRSSGVNTVGSGPNPGPVPQGTLGTSGVESKFSSLAQFLFFVANYYTFLLFFLTTVTFFLIQKSCFPVIAEADNGSVDSDYVYDPSSG